MRLIDADALMVSENECQQKEDCRTCRLFIRGCEDFAAVIEDAPTIEPDSKWIPTSTRKPDKAGQYLVTKEQKTKGVRQLATAHYNPALDDWSGNGNFKNVVAWMPLPTIYGGD